MNLKDPMKNLTDEEIRVMLKYLDDLQREKPQEVKVEPEHFYEFTGTWSYGVWATSKEEAERCFKNAYDDDFEIITDEYKVEQYE